MSEVTKEPGDVASTLSLSHYFQYHATHHHDVAEVWSETESENGYGFLMQMADGSHVRVLVESYFA